MVFPAIAISAISGIANRPSAKGTSGMPSSRYKDPKVQRSIAVFGSSPTVAIISPTAAAASPLSGLPPLRTPINDNPNMQKARSSGEPKLRMNGRRIGMLKARKSAPQSPPSSDAEKAAPNARAARPCFAIGWPSSIVDADPTVPGTPNKTAGMVSDVATTACSPTKNASAVNGSISNVKGRSNDRPTIPLSPGITPSDKPITTPNATNMSREGSKTISSALSAISNIVLSAVES